MVLYKPVVRFILVYLGIPVVDVDSWPQSGLRVNGCRNPPGEEGPLAGTAQARALSPVYRPFLQLGIGYQ